MYNTKSQIKFKFKFMLNSSLCDCSDTCMRVKGTITIEIKKEKIIKE